MAEQPIEQEVEYVTTARLGEKGQITIPKDWRDRMGLESGSPIAIVRVGTGLMLFAEHDRFKELCDRISDLITERGLPEHDLLVGLPSVIANQERILSNQERIISNQEKILAK
jgi:AbrB family looped-hinge helix DNA binding protein